MVQIAGKYQVVGGENFKEFLIKRGVPEDRAKEADETKSKLDVSVDGKEIKFVSDFQNFTTRILIDGELEETIPVSGSDNVIKNSAKQDNNVITVVSKSLDGKLLVTRTYTFTDSGLETVYILADNFSAKRFYKRL